MSAVCFFESKYSDNRKQSVEIRKSEVILSDSFRKSTIELSYPVWISFLDYLQSFLSHAGVAYPDIRDYAGREISLALEIDIPYNIGEQVHVTMVKHGEGLALDVRRFKQWASGKTFRTTEGVRLNTFAASKLADSSLVQPLSIFSRGDLKAVQRSISPDLLDEVHATAIWLEQKYNGVWEEPCKACHEGEADMDQHGCTAQRGQSFDRLYPLRNWSEIAVIHKKRTGFELSDGARGPVVKELLALITRRYYTENYNVPHMPGWESVF
jgi:hypothetical protein